MRIDECIKLHLMNGVDLKWRDQRQTIRPGIVDSPAEGLLMDVAETSRIVWCIETGS